MYCVKHVAALEIIRGSMDVLGSTLRSAPYFDHDLSSLPARVSGTCTFVRLRRQCGGPGSPYSAAGFAVGQFAGIFVEDATVSGDIREQLPERRYIGLPKTSLP